MIRIVWLQAALDDLRDIHDYIARDNPAAARRIIATVRDDVKLLQQHPAVVHSSRLWPESLPR